MARQEIDLTTPQPNGKMGEPTKSAWEKVNDMTEELYADSVTTNTTQVITAKKIFGDSASSSDRVEISKLGITGLSSQNASTAYGFTYDSKLPNISENIVARFQALDINGGATYARIFASNFLGSAAEYIFSNAGTATAINWNSTSDERIKTDFVEIEDALKKVKSITGYSSFSKRSNTFENAEPRRVVMSGVKAQQVKSVLPAAVSSGTSGYDNNNNIIDEILSVDPLGLCALLIEAVKELDDKFESLKKTQK